MARAQATRLSRIPIQVDQVCYVNCDDRLFHFRRLLEEHRAAVPVTHVPRVFFENRESTDVMQGLHHRPLSLQRDLVPPSAIEATTYAAVAYMVLVPLRDSDAVSLLVPGGEVERALALCFVLYSLPTCQFAE